MDVEKLHSECLLCPLSDVLFKKSVAALNARFTTRRNALSGYGEDAQQVSAYAAFYLPTNMKKLAFMLSQTGALNLFGHLPLEVVDFGCGPGTYSFALYEYFQSRWPTETMADENGAKNRKKEMLHFRFVDSALPMLAQARKIQQMMYPEMAADYQQTLPPSQPGKQRLVILGNVLNEIGMTGFESIFSAMDARVVICIEPGTQASFSLMSSLRARMIGNGYGVRYPCAANTACPLQGTPAEWCHQVQKVRLEPALARLGQLAELDRTVMPFIGHIYSKTMSVTWAETAIGDGDRMPWVESRRYGGVLFRLKTHSKHAFFWEVCMHTDAGLQIKKVELPKKHFSKQENKALLRISSGQRISFEIEKILGDGTLRICRLKSDLTGTGRSTIFL